jgi:hypothetical protein
MKTINTVLSGGTPERVKNAEAEKLVKSGGYAYCKKDVWKHDVRDIGSRAEREAEQKRKDEAKAKREADAAERKAKADKRSR